MRKYSLLYLVLVLTTVLGILHFIAEAFYLYWTVWWFDNLMHLLAGLTGGFIVVWFLSRSLFFEARRFSSYALFLYPVLSVIVVGVVWEIFEYTNNLSQPFEGYTLDVFLDLFFDVLGAASASLIGLRRVFRSSD